MNEPSPNMTKSRKTRDSPMHKNIFECSHCRETFEEIKMCSGVRVFAHLGAINLAHSYRFSAKWLAIARNQYGLRV